MKNIQYLKILMIISTLLCQMNFIWVSGQVIEAQSGYDIAKNSIETLFSHIVDLSKSNQDTGEFVKGVDGSLEKLQLAKTAMLEKKYAESMVYSREANQIAIELLSDIAKKSSQIIPFTSDSVLKELIQTVVVTLAFFLLWNRATTSYHKKILNSLPEAMNIES